MMSKSSASNMHLVVFEISWPLLSVFIFIVTVTLVEIKIFLMNSDSDIGIVLQTFTLVK